MIRRAPLRIERCANRIADSCHPVARLTGPLQWVTWSLVILLALAVMALPSARAQEPDRPVPAPDTPPAVAPQAAPSTTDESTTAKKSEPAWKALFDGKSLDGWKVSGFGGEGEIEVRDGAIDMGMGSPLTGITYTNKFPKYDYELLVEAMRIDGSDFFSTITFPVDESFCSLVVGGWGGAVVGISCINRADASENETTRFMKFESKKWYRIRVEVRRDHLRAWIDDKQVVDVDVKNRKLSTRSEVFLTEPLGISSYVTHSAIRKIEVRPLTAEAGK